MPAIEREVVIVKPPPGLVHHFAPEVAVPGLGKTNCRDAAGNLIVADSENYTICKIEAEAIVTTIPGGRLGPDQNGGPAVASLDRSHGCGISPDGNLCIADGKKTPRKAIGGVGCVPSGTIIYRGNSAGMLL